MDMKTVGTFYYENFVSKELVNTIDVFIAIYLISKYQYAFQKFAFPCTANALYVHIT